MQTSSIPNPPAFLVVQALSYASLPERLAVRIRVLESHLFKFAAPVQLVVSGVRLLSQVLHVHSDQHLPQLHKVTVVFIFNCKKDRPATERMLNSGAKSPLSLDPRPQFSKPEFFRHTSRISNQPAPKDLTELGVKPSHANTQAPVQSLSLDLQDLWAAHLSQSSRLSMHFCTSKLTIRLHTGFHFQLKSTLNPSHQPEPKQKTKPQFPAAVKGKVMRRPRWRCCTLSMPANLTKEP